MAGGPEVCAGSASERAGYNRADARSARLVEPGTNTLLAQQPREQLFQQNSGLKIHLSKFDAHPLTRHDVSDNRLRQNHASGYFKNKGQVRAYSHRSGSAEEQTSHA